MQKLIPIKLLKLIFQALKRWKTNVKQREKQAIQFNDLSILRDTNTRLLNLIYFYNESDTKDDEDNYDEDNYPDEVCQPNNDFWGVNETVAGQRDAQGKFTIHNQKK